MAKVRVFTTPPTIEQADKRWFRITIHDVTGQTLTALCDRHAAQGAKEALERALDAAECRVLPFAETG